MYKKITLTLLSLLYTTNTLICHTAWEIPRNICEAIAEKLPKDTLKVQEKPSKPKKEKEYYQIDIPELSQNEINHILQEKVLAPLINQSDTRSRILERTPESTLFMLPKQWEDLYLISGPKNNIDYNIVNALVDQKWGATIKQVAKIRILLPSKEIDICRKEKQLIQTLINNPKIIHKLKPLYNRLKNIEPLFYSLYTQKGAFSPIFYDKMKEIFDPQGKFDSFFWMNFYRYLKFEGNFIQLFFVACGIIYNIFEGLKNPTLRFIGYLPIKILSIFFTYFATIAIYKAMKGIYTAIGRDLLGYACEVVSIVHELLNTLDQHPEVKLAFEKKLRYTYNHFSLKQGNPNFIKIIQILKDNNFKKWSLWDSAATLCNAYGRLKDHIHLFNKTMFELGYFGTYLVAADKILTDGWNFVEYVEKDQPFFHTNSFYNPCINPNKAITNQIHLDGEKAHIIVMTGGNGSGKTTTIEGILQTWVIACACGGVAPVGKDTSISTIEAIITAKNITNNPSLELSSFQSEALVAQKISQISQEKQGKTIFILDEFFNTTNNAECTSLNLGLCLNLYQQKNRPLIMISTHDEQLIKELKRYNQARFLYMAMQWKNNFPIPTYKIKKGISPDKIAIRTFLDITGEKNIYKEAKSYYERNYGKLKTS